MQRRVLQKLRATPFCPSVRHLAQSEMEFLNEPRLADPRLADDQHQLAIAPPRPLPAPHQHRDLFLATHQRREMALSGAAPATARPHEPEQSHWLRHAFESVAAALLGDKQTGNLALDPRCHNDRTWLRKSLYARR